MLLWCVCVWWEEKGGGVGGAELHTLWCVRVCVCVSVLCVCVCLEIVGTTQVTDCVVCVCDGLVCYKFDSWLLPLDPRILFFHKSCFINILKKFIKTKDYKKNS